jgi:probable HAF family extracellular repeat protein
MHHRQLSIRLAIGLGVVATMASAAPQPFTYSVGSISVTDLGTLNGGASNAAEGINDQGDIVGWAKDGSNVQHAFVYLASTAGPILSLHSSTPAWSTAVARSVNNDQVVVGEYRQPDGRIKPFYYYPGIWLTPSPTNATGPIGFSWDASAYSINAAHRIVGWAGRFPLPGDPPVPNTGGACYDELPVRWSNAGADPAMLFCPTDVDDDGFVDGPVRAHDIADNGDVVGVDGQTSSYSMFLHRAGTRYSVPWVAGWPAADLGGEPFQGTARGVNSNGWVVGHVPYHAGFGAYKQRAFAWNGTDATSTDIGMMSGGNTSLAHKVNGSNMVIGTANRAYGSTLVEAGFIWHPHFGLKQLPSRWLTGSLQATRPTSCEAKAVNELQSGIVQAVGSCLMPNGSRRAVRWDITINKNYQPMPDL